MMAFFSYVVAVIKVLAVGQMLVPGSESSFFVCNSLCKSKY